MNFLKRFIILLIFVSSSVFCNNNGSEPNIFQLKVYKAKATNNFMINNPSPFQELWTKFFCTNPTTGNTSQIIVDSTDLQQKLDCSKPIGFLIPGIQNFNNFMPWMEQFSTEWSYFRDINVCRVDWSALSETGNTNASTDVPRATANYVSTFIKTLIKKKYFDLSKVKLIGHGLGAHIAGYIGYNFNGQIPEIYGLDPLGPGFSSPLVVEPYMRLDRTDAKYVVAIHSCEPYYGITIPIGHKDIYINAGLAMLQRGCGPVKYIDPVVPESDTCAHFRAVKVFQDSLDPKNDRCLTIGCRDSDEYFAQRCSGDIDQMGFSSIKKIGRFFMSVGDKPVCTKNLYL